MEAASVSRTSFPPVSRSEWLGAARAPSQPVAHDVAELARDRSHSEQNGASGADERLIACEGPSWSIVQRVDDPNPKRANAQAQYDLANGATGLAIVFEGAPNAFGYGIPARPEALVAALHGVALNKCYLRIDVHPASRASVDWIVEIMRRKKVDPARLNLSFGIDPTAILAGVGRLKMSLEALRASMPQSLAHFFAMGLPAVLLEADGRVVHNAGASDAQELGVMLASAVSHLRLFEEARQPLVYALPHIGFALCTDQDQFLSIAKVQALRRLWRRVQDSCALPPSTPRIHVETSYRMMASRDPQTNIHRCSMAAFAAAVSGADSISVLPHTIARGLPEQEARRIARNAQLVLGHETHLSALGNPVAGSEDLDLLTASLCEAAWNEFRRIEAEGGLLESLARGHVQARIRASRDERLRNYAEQRLRLVGASAFPTDQEMPARTLRAERQRPVDDGIEFCEPLPAMRIDEQHGARR